MASQQKSPNLHPNPENLYKRRFYLAMIFYFILVPSTIYLLPFAANTIWRFPLALLPTVPIVFILIAFLRYLRQLDELQQRIQLEACGFSLAGTALITFSLGFLENAGLPQVSLIWVLPLIILLWRIGVTFASRRYQ